MARPKPNVKSDKLLQWFDDFSAGLNTQDALHKVKDNEFVEGTNIDIEETGAVSKRKGFTKIVGSLGAGRVQGMYLNQRFGARELLMVHNGSLYRYDTTSAATFLGTGSWIRVPILRHTPVGVGAILQDLASGESIGPNLVASTQYQYRVSALDANGETLASPDADPVSRVTQGTTLKKVLVSWNKVYGATGYKIYRNGVLLTTVGDVASWTDMGTTSPGAGSPPATNTTEVTIPLTSEVEFVNYNDTCFFTTGNGLCIYVNGLANLVIPYLPSNVEIEAVGANALLSTTSSLHRCRFITVHWNRLFISGDPALPQMYYFSDLNLSPEYPKMYFPAFYSGDVTTDNGSAITGMHKYRDALIFFTSTSIHALFGIQPDENKPEPFIQRPIHPSIGCIAPRSIAVVGNALIFASRLGIYALTNVVASNTAMNVQLLSQKIQPTFKRLTYPEKSVAVYHDHQYKICFPEDGIVLRWYVSKQAWSLDTAPKVTVYSIVDNDLYMASYTEGVVWKFGFKRVPDSEDPNIYVEVETYSDDGEPIPFYLRTKSYDMDAMINLKKFKEGFIAGKQYSVPSYIDVDGYIDYTHITEHIEFVESTAVGNWELSESKLGWLDVLEMPMKKFRGKGRQCYFVLKNSYADQPLTIYGLGVEFKIKSA